MEAAASRSDPRRRLVQTYATTRKIKVATANTTTASNVVLGSEKETQVDQDESGVNMV